MALRSPDARRPVFLAAVIAAAASFLLAEGARAADPESLGRFRDWEAFSAVEQGQKICYALTAPTDSKGNYSSRDPAFVMVTRRPSEGVYDEVSAIAGYTYQKGSQPTMTVKKAKFAAASVNDVAWPKIAETPKLVAAMKAGAVLILDGVSSRGTKTRDEFSLRGFTAALGAIQKSCPKR